MKLYIVCVTADRKTRQGRQIQSKAFLLTAGNDINAECDAIALALSEWPTEQGWTSHQTLVTAVQDDMIAIIKALPEPK